LIVPTLCVGTQQRTLRVPKTEQTRSVFFIVPTLWMLRVHASFTVTQSATGLVRGNNQYNAYAVMNDLREYMKIVFLFIICAVLTACS
jgi:hypothetical protein